MTYLTIAIPTVRRVDEDGKDVSYLGETLASLLCEQGNFKVVVVDAEVGGHVIPHCFESNDERLEVTLTDSVLYPAWPLQPKTPVGICTNDTPERTLWRSKQVLDAVLAMEFCQGKSEWYMHTEDDAVAKPGWFQLVVDYLTQNQHQKYVRFGAQGAIGHCFNRNITYATAEFLRRRYDDLPLDWLLDSFPLKSVQGPVLFDHRGLVSSLRGQTR